MNKEPTQKEEIEAAEYRYFAAINDAIDVLDNAVEEAELTLEREYTIIRNRYKFQMN